MDPDWRCTVFPIKTGDIPASYISLPEGKTLVTSEPRTWCPFRQPSVQLRRAEDGGRCAWKKGRTEITFPGNQRNIFPQGNDKNHPNKKCGHSVGICLVFHKQQRLYKADSGRQGKQWPPLMKFVVPYNPGGHYYPVGFGQTNKPKGALDFNGWIHCWDLKPALASRRQNTCQWCRKDKCFRFFSEKTLFQPMPLRPQ